MQKDEDKARELIQRHRELMKPIIEKYSGEILQYVGDGAFCSFERAIKSANCAVEIQKGFKTDEEISLRIGIHVRDVVIEGDEVYADGVNVASRLESLSAPGGVNISGKHTYNFHHLTVLIFVFRTIPFLRVSNLTN